MAANPQDNISTRVISITAAGTPIVAHTFCRRIKVQQNYTSAVGPTSDLGQTAPVGGGTIIILSGTVAVFTAAGGPNGCYSPGDIAGTVSCLDVAGPIAGQQIEDQLV